MKLELTLITDDDKKIKLPDLFVGSVELKNTFIGKFQDTALRISTDENDIDFELEDNEEHKNLIYELIRTLKAHDKL